MSLIISHILTSCVMKDKSILLSLYISLYSISYLVSFFSLCLICVQSYFDLKIRILEQPFELFFLHKIYSKSAKVYIHQVLLRLLWWIFHNRPPYISILCMIILYMKDSEKSFLNKKAIQPF